MKIIIAGVGPGRADLISYAAVRAAETSDLILVPRSSNNNNDCQRGSRKPGIAESLIFQYVNGKEIHRIFFPMIRDSKRRDEIISEQLIKLEAKLRGAEKIFFPVIGDSVLYSTGAYLIEGLKKIFADIEVEFIPGISAHSLACACAKKFMAMSEEIFCVISGTAGAEKILRALSSCDAAAIYKPVAMKDKEIFDFIAARFKKIIRVDFAGLPSERIIEGREALGGINEYLSVILLGVRS